MWVSNGCPFEQQCGFCSLYLRSWLVWLLEILPLLVVAWRLGCPRCCHCRPEWRRSGTTFAASASRCPGKTGLQCFHSCATQGGCNGEALALAQARQAAQLTRSNGTNSWSRRLTCDFVFGWFEFHGVTWGSHLSMIGTCVSCLEMLWRIKRNISWFAFLHGFSANLFANKRCCIMRTS